MKYLFLLFVLIIFSCKEEIKNSIVVENKKTEKPISRKLDNKEVPENRLTLQTTPVSMNDQDHIEGNLYGAFHCNRAHYYIIKKPQNKIFSSKTNTITLYYLDSILYRTQYVLQDDITTQLLNELGSFRITGFDFKNRDIIASGSIISRTEKGIILNKALDNYELKWTFGSKEIRYRVNPESNNRFVYQEREKNYEAKYKNVERYCL